MTRPSRRSIARALALLSLVACHGAGSDSPRSARPLPDGEEVATTTVGMWGNDDGWSLVEPLRLGAIDRNVPAGTRERPCTRAEARPRVHPLDARLEKVSAAPFDEESSTG